MTKVVSGPGMKRPNAILFGSDIASWEDNKDMKREESRHLVPLVPIVPNASSGQHDVKSK